MTLPNVITFDDAVLVKGALLIAASSHSTLTRADIVSLSALAQELIDAFALIDAATSTAG